MELRTLRSFLAVAREGNVTRAARQLHITQPALSRQLADLEREIGCELLVREPRGVTLTEQGLPSGLGHLEGTDAASKVVGDVVVKVNAPELLEDMLRGGGWTRYLVRGPSPTRGPSVVVPWSILRYTCEVQSKSCVGGTTWIKTPPESSLPSIRLPTCCAVP